MSKRKTKQSRRSVLIKQAKEYRVSAFKAADAGDTKGFLKCKAMYESAMQEVKAIDAKRHDAPTKKKPRSIRTVSGGLPSLGKRR